MSYCVYVGRNLTADGKAYLGGYGDEPSSHWLELIPRQHHEEDATVEVGLTEAAEMPGERHAIPQVAETARHLRVSYSFYRGAPAPITNGGLNEHGVAVRDIWSPSRQELKDMTPPLQHGPNYSDLARLVLERARTAREGVELIGQLIADHGYSTYGGNSHFIADHDEGWVVIEYAGGAGLWAAQRVGPDEIRVSRPGYILDISADFQNDPNILAAPHLVTFAVEQGWYDPDSGEPFNVNQVYGDGLGRWDGIQWMEGEMRKRAAEAERISIEDVMWAVRTEQLTGDTAGYGQVVPLAPQAHAELGMLWHTASGAVAAPFAPVFLGSAEIPPEFGQHRYLTFDESRRFVDARKGQDVSSQVPQHVEATRNAFRAVKRLMYYLFEHYESYLPEATELFEAREGRLLREVEGVLKSAEILLEAGQQALAEQHLTYYQNNELMRGLEMVETLTNYLETRTRLEPGLRDGPGFVAPEQIW